uniref:BAR domain-containing protein n=1 Tax=Rhodosorus marinus TaxID=101924 RepID=A0A7S2ZFQ4_9RHOD|mmetsp:Transcript_18103/g.72450  ORF Transcript_18103/g.72450 Transcript_18103/m.72450 type:complete len:327 (+) Transcript_18103:67-1047(+)
MESFLDSVRRMGQSCTKDLPAVRPKSSAGGFAQPRKAAKEEKKYGDEDVMKKKKLVTEYGKGMKAMIASIQGSEKQWTQLREKTVECKKRVADGSGRALEEPMDALEMQLNSASVVDYDNQVELLKDYLARCEKVVNVECKLYNKVRQDWETKNSKLRRSSATGERLDRLTLSVEQAQMKWDLHKKQLDENLTPLVDEGPAYLEAGALVMAKIQHANMVPYKQNLNAFETVLEHEQEEIKAKLNEAGLGDVFGEAMNGNENAPKTPQAVPSAPEPIAPMAPVPTTSAGKAPAEFPDYSLSKGANNPGEGTWATPPAPQGATYPTVA